MANDVNKVILIGRLGQDPELRYTAAGDAVVSFGLATNKSWTSKSGEKKSKTTWHNISAWRKLAEICGEYLRKGSQIYIEGELTYRDWQDESGNKKSKVEIVMTTMQMLGSKETSSPATREVKKEEMADEEIPF